MGISKVGFIKEKALLTNTAENEWNKEPSSVHKDIDYVCQGSKSKKSNESKRGWFVGAIFKKDNLSSVDNGTERALVAHYNG